MKKSIEMKIEKIQRKQNPEKDKIGYIIRMVSVYDGKSNVPISIGNIAQRATYQKSEKETGYFRDRNKVVRG